MILIGSKALQQYIPNLGRIIHDWDLLMHDDEYVQFIEQYLKYLIKAVKNTFLYEIPDLGIVEISHVNGWEPSDWRLLDNGFSFLGTPFGKVCVPNLQILFEMKKATAEFINEPKHNYDLKLIQSLVSKDITPFYEMRRNEIKTRIEKENKIKYDFFHKYHIPEYIRHDYLHEVIADLIDVKLPTYVKITTAETDITEQLFNNLTHEAKVSLMAEESLVLILERWFIPQMIEKGINFKLLDIFFNNNEGLPTYNILKHCCITGLKGEAEYITNFSRANFFEIEKLWVNYKQKIKNKGGFPKEFYDMIFVLRDKYKQGEKVALT